MTHAFMHQTNIKSVKPHGKEFMAKIREINKKLKLNITARHRYINWLRCDGPCRNLEMNFFGYMSTLDNQLSPNQYKPHLMCGGTFKSVEEPPKDMLKLILKRCKKHKRTKLDKAKKKKPRDDDSGYLSLHMKQSGSLKIIDYVTSDDEA